MTINEAIAHAREVAAKQRSASAEWLEQSNEEGSIEEEISKGCEKCAQEHEQLANWLEELKQYQAIGTLEECRVALEKQKTKKPIYDKPIGVLECPCCGNYLQKVVDDEGSTEGFIPNHCSNCGQNIDADWSDL